MNLLHLDSSILGENSGSRMVSKTIVQNLREKLKSSDLKIVYRDLVADPIQHLDGKYLAGQSADVKHDQDLQRNLKLGGDVLSEYLAADIVVIGAPLYNFGIPSQLKAWVDRIAVAGKTFSYTETGAKGLAKNKRVILAVSRGGLYGPGSPSAPHEHSESHLRAVFEFLQVEKLEVIVAEGLALGPEPRAKALAEATGKAKSLS